MTEKRVQELLGQMQKTLECSICLEMMENPVSTSCGHQFCRFCLLKMLDKKLEVLCPLCKKPVTKRSLMKREQLGEMIQGVRNLISTFQKDTGSLFSPPRGLQANLLPGTPDVIQAKSSVVKKHARETRVRNVRQSARKQANESITENSTSTTGSSERIPDDSDNDNNGKGKRNERKKSQFSQETNLRQQELLRCIEEGSHHAINCPFVDNIDSDCRPFGGSKRKDIKDIKESEEKLKELKENSSKDKEEVDKTNVDDEEDCDLDVPVLSGNSVARGSETSSGPLFKTPMDPKRKTNSDIDTEVPESRSLRSNNKRLNYDESKSDDNGSIKLTPEVLVVNESAVNRTYSRKDKDSFIKEKKANKKVAEWLKNIPSAAESGCKEIQEPKRNKQQKKPNAKSLKVVKEEEAMGSKIKHLAKQIHDKDLLFVTGDFNIDEDASDVIISASVSHNKDVQKDSVDNEDPDEGHKPKHDMVEVITKSVNQNEVGTIEKKIVNDLVSENQSSINDSVVSNSETEGVKNPIRKKKIFKSRTDGQPKASEKYLDKAKGIFISTKQLDKSKAAEKSVSVNIVRTSESMDEPFDPYEFKSSQNTPKKSTVMKRKQKKNASLTSKRNRNKKNADVKLKVREGKEQSEADKKLEKMWDKDLIPDKTILKVKLREEIDKITASIQQAESYDLLTCTQEAVDKIAQDEERSNQLNEVKTKNEILSKSVYTQKKVRFTEPVISDFINAGKVDIIGYRKAQKKFMAEYTEIKEENYSEEKGEEVDIKCIESEKAESNLSKSPLRANLDKKNKDKESDDLSEDNHFHDDSSGTDDLDIEPTPEQFEKPNLDIQPEEIKSQLLQVGQDVVNETPLILVNKDSPNSLIVEETPAVLCGPKFNKALSKPARKGQKMRTSSNSSVDFSKIDVANNVSDEDIEVKDVLEGKSAQVFSNDKETVKEKILETTDTVFRQEILKQETSMNKIEVQVDSEETKSPDDDLTLKTAINTDMEITYADNEPNMHETAVSECVSSQSTLTQNSESLLCVKTVPLKTNFTNQTSANENEVLKNTNETNEGKDFSLKEKQTGQNIYENVIGLENEALPNRKRKSFMLEETKESLDFGSLGECSVVDVDEDSEGVCRAKRQRVSRLRRSPMNKECTSGRKSKNNVLWSKMDEKVTENPSDFDIGELETVEKNQDTVVSDSEVTEPALPDSNKGQVNEKTEKNEASENTRQVCHIYRKSPQSYNVNSLETIDMIGETEMSNTDDFIMNEITKKKNENNGDGENFDSVRSEKDSNENLKQSDCDLKSSLENDVVKVRHLSGMFISPQDSLVLTGVKSSPENLFHIGSEMPSIDLSPDEGTVKPLNHSPSLELGTVDSLESADLVESSLKQEETLLKGNDKNDVNDFTVKSHLDPLSRSIKIKNIQDIDSSPEEMQSKSTIKSVRGFSKKKRMSKKETNEILSSDSVNDDLSRTPQSVTKRKSKSPFSKILNTNVRESVQNKIIKDEAEEKIEFKNGHEDRVCLEEGILRSELNDLPDIDFGNKKESSETVNFDPFLNTNNKGCIEENKKITKRLKTPPKLLLKSPGKELNVVLPGCDNEEEKGDKEIEDVNENLVQTPKEEFEEEQISEDENSRHSSTSSEFRLDSSDEEECPKKQALDEISKFDKIVENCMELENLSNAQSDKKLRTKDPFLKAVKTGMKSDWECLKDEPGNFSYTQKNVLPRKKMKDEIVSRIDTENMYCTRLDSSPSVHDDAVSDSEQVILESDLDEDDDSEEKRKECLNVVDDDDSSDVAVVRRKGVKRAIMSDSSSDDEDDNSRHLSITSSSAFSSQSENLTTQERYSLEKEVERMAREMEAMKEQLRRSKEMKWSKRSESKLTPNPVTVDDSEEEDMIEAVESVKGDDGDMYLSQPEVYPSDLQLEEETVNPAVTLDVQSTHDNQNSKVEPDETKDPEETVEMNGEIQTIPDTDLSQNLSRQPLVDLDTNVPQSVTPGKKKHIGIVVTGLNHKQIQQTKKLAALNDVKFFTKFNDQVTHVVVKPAEEDDTICDRTLKFFQGISRRCWIVNFFWVVDSREVGHLLPEGPYEIQGDTANNEAHYGPKRARLSKDKLFSKIQFSLIGENTYLSKESMTDLIEACGGEVLDISQLGQGHKKSLVVSCSDIDQDKEEEENITKHARDVYKRLAVVTLTREWILDSLTMYTLQPLKDYVINKGPNVKVPKI